MADDRGEPAAGPDSPPWPQKLYDSVWLIAGAAIVFFFLSYVLWGLVDLATVPGG